MFAVTAARISPDDPLAALELGDRPEPALPDGWAAVTVKAASLNHHDVWTLRGVGISADRLPIVLGCDAAGLDEDGNEVVVHAVIGESGSGDETLDPRRSLLSERYDGTFAERVAVPLKSMCSTKCAMPLWGCVSCRDPRVSQTPMLTERTCGIVSVMRRRPVSRTSRVIMSGREPVSDCRERDYRKRLHGGCYHALPLQCKRVHAEKLCWTGLVQ